MVRRIRRKRKSDRGADRTVREEGLCEEAWEQSGSGSGGGSPVASGSRGCSREPGPRAGGGRRRWEMRRESSVAGEAVARSYRDFVASSF